MTELEVLFENINDNVAIFPKSMKPIAGEIKGIGFFPGGKGTFNNDDTIWDKEVMVLGQDFDTYENYNIAKENGQEDIEKNPTWRNILEYLKSVDVSPSNCFFTNAILGCRTEGSSTGKSPAFKETEFLRYCRSFLLRQLDMQQPKIIFVLGKHVAEFLSATSEDLACWKKIKNFASVDAAGKQIIKARFNNNVESTVVLLTHPSFRPSNVHRRSYLNYVGKEAEEHMGKHACQELTQ